MHDVTPRGAAGMVSSAGSTPRPLARSLAPRTLARARLACSSATPHSRLPPPLAQFHPEFWGEVSDGAKDLIGQMLSRNPDDRPSAVQLLQHPWIGSSEEELRAKGLMGAQARIKEFNAKRKLKGGVRAVMALNTMNKGIRAFVTASQQRKKSGTGEGKGGGKGVEKGGKGGGQGEGPGEGAKALDESENGLRSAAMMGEESQLVALLALKTIDVNAADDHGLTALSYATIAGQSACVGHLLKAGAATNLKDVSSMTALEWAKEEGHADIVALLEAAQG